MNGIRTASHRGAWNKGNLVGQKAPFKLQEIWATRVRLQMQGRLRDLPYSIWGSTASCAPATWSSCVCATCATGTGWLRARGCFSKRPSVRSSSRSRRRPARRWKRGSSQPG